MRLSVLWSVVHWALGWVLHGLAQAVLPLGSTGRAVARPLLGVLVQLQPRNSWARAYYDYLRALRIFPSGQTDEALRLLHRAHRTAPDDEAVHLDWAVALTMAGRYDQAIGVLEQLGKDSENVIGEQQYWSALGWAYLCTGRFPLAQNAAKQAAEHRVATGEMRLIMSLALLGEQGWVDASGVSDILKKRPRSVVMVLEFIYYLISLGKHSEAEKLLAAVPEAMRPQGWWVVAQHSLDEDDLQAAQWVLEKLTELDPAAATSLLLASEVAARRGAWPTAVASAERALAQEPADVNVLETAGRMMVLAGEREKAFRYMTEALANGSRDALAGGVVALHLLEQDRVADARLVFRVQRTGDELACLYGHTAMAWLLQLEDKPVEALALATQAYDFWQQLPAWARTDAVRQSILPRLTAIARFGEKAERQATRGDAADLLCRLDSTAAGTDGD